MQMHPIEKLRVCSAPWKEDKATQAFSRYLEDKVKFSDDFYLLVKGFSKTHFFPFSQKRKSAPPLLTIFVPTCLQELNVNKTTNLRDLFVSRILIQANLVNPQRRNKKH